MAKRVERGSVVTLPEAWRRVKRGECSPDECCIRIIWPRDRYGDGSEKWFDSLKERQNERVRRRFAQIGYEVTITLSYYNFVPRGKRQVVYYIIHPKTLGFQTLGVVAALGTPQD